MSRHYSTSNKLKLLFFGTDDFASLHLKALIKEKSNKKNRLYTTSTDTLYIENDNSCIESLELICPPDRFTGRKLETLTPSNKRESFSNIGINFFFFFFLKGETKGVAELYNIPVHHTPLQAKTLNDWHLPKDQQYDLGVVVSFGYFIPPHIISQFRFGAINVHPSLLPKYRGAAPIQHAIINGDHETGVTVQELDDKEFDAGRILAQERVV